MVWKFILIFGLFYTHVFVSLAQTDLIIEEENTIFGQILKKSVSTPSMLETSVSKNDNSTNNQINKATQANTLTGENSIAGKISNSVWLYTTLALLATGLVYLIVHLKH